MDPYVDISVKLVLHFFLGIRINVTLVSEKVDCATCNMQLVNKLRRKQCVQTANVIYQSGQKTRSGCIYVGYALWQYGLLSFHMGVLS